MQSFWADHLEVILKFGNLIGLALGFALLIWRQGRAIGQTESKIEKIRDMAEKNCKTTLENKRNIESLRDYSVKQFNRIESEHYVTHPQHEVQSAQCKRNIYLAIDKLKEETNYKFHEHSDSLKDINSNLREIIKEHNKQFNEIKDLVHGLHKK